MIRPIEVEPRDGFRIWLRYSDGATGEVDLSDVAGRGVFETWNEPGFLRQSPHLPSQVHRPGTTTSSSAPMRSTWRSRASR